MLLEYDSYNEYQWILVNLALIQQFATFPTRFCFLHLKISSAKHHCCLYSSKYVSLPRSSASTLTGWDWESNQLTSDWPVFTMHQCLMPVSCLTFFHHGRLQSNRIPKTSASRQSTNYNGKKNPEKKGCILKLHFLRKIATITTEYNICQKTNVWCMNAKRATGIFKNHSVESN